MSTLLLHHQFGIVRRKLTRRASLSVRAVHHPYVGSGGTTSRFTDKMLHREISEGTVAALREEATI